MFTVNTSRTETHGQAGLQWTFTQSRPGDFYEVIHAVEEGGVRGGGYLRGWGRKREDEGGRGRER